MIKAILSDGYDITTFTADNDISNLYLGYIKSKGYILIHEKDSNTWFYPIKSDKQPYQLESNWRFDWDEITAITTTFDKIFKHYLDAETGEMKGNYNKTRNDLYTDVIGDLILNLYDRTNAGVYTRMQDTNNEDIKKFLLDPVETFNYYLDNKPISYEEYKETKNSVKTGLETRLNDLIKFFNDNKDIVGYTDKDETATGKLLDKNELLKIINRAAKDSISNPILNLNLGVGNKDFNKVNAIDEIITEFNIKRSYNNNVEQLYMFNNNLNYFEKITDTGFKNKIRKRYGFNVLKPHITSILDSISIENKVYDNLLVFNNILYDTEYLNEFQFPICEYNRKDYLTVNRIGFEDDDGNIKLLHYDMDLALTDVLKVKDLPEDDSKTSIADYKEKHGMTYTEKVVRQILIPKNNPNDLRMFKDFMERLGSSITGENLYKSITLYYNDLGNNGKSVLKLLFELIFNKQCFPLTPADLDDDFNLPAFIGRKALLIDEIDKNDFNKIKPEIKRMSSRFARREQRIMRSQEYAIINTYPNLFIFANVLIYLTMEDVAVFDRVDFLKLPNKFVIKDELHKFENTYLMDKNTETKLKKDIDGLSWLITASILAYKSMKATPNATYTLKQTVEESMDIFLDTDYVTKFIKLYTERDEDLIPDDFITTSEIASQFKQYMELQNKKVIYSDLELSRKIGKAIKTVYNVSGKFKDNAIYNKRDNKVATYGIRLKSFDELAKEFKYVYKINESVTDGEFKQLDYSTDNKNVYHKIQSGINTINLLSKAFPDLNVVEVVKTLESLNLIYNTYQTNITEV